MRALRIAFWVSMLGFGFTAPIYTYPPLVSLIWCFGLFACSFNLLFGSTGLLSFGHAAFFGGAAYISGYCVTAFHLGPIEAVVIGIGVGLVLGVIFAVIAVRRTGIYFAMITLALAEVIHFLANQLPFTGGEDGLQGITVNTLFGIYNLNNPVRSYYFIFVLFLIGFVSIRFILRSPFGLSLQAIRDHEGRALSLGYDIQHYKRVAFIISAAFAGMAGSMKALSVGFVVLEDVHWMTSGDVVLMTLIGGVNTLFGPVVGAFIVTGLNTGLSFIGSWLQVVIGLIFIACVIFFKKGIVGSILIYIDSHGKQRVGLNGKRKGADATI